MLNRTPVGLSRGSTSTKQRARGVGLAYTLRHSPTSDRRPDVDDRHKATGVRLRRRWTKRMAWIQLCFARTRLNEARRAPSHAVPVYGVWRVAESGAARLV